MDGRAWTLGSASMNSMASGLPIPLLSSPRGILSRIISPMISLHECNARLEANRSQSEKGLRKKD